MIEINFRETRKQLGLERKQMAFLLGMPVRTYDDWEKVVTTPRDVTLEGCAARIAKYLAAMEANA